MNSKNNTDVVIGGKLFTLSGYEDTEYLQRVASYLNSKINEYSAVESFNRQDSDTQSILIQLNIADDYFKAKKQIEFLEEELKKKENELYASRHEQITTQIKLENAEKQIKELQKQ